MTGIRVIDRRGFLAASVGGVTAAICRADEKPEATATLVAKAARSSKPRRRGASITCTSS